MSREQGRADSEAGVKRETQSVPEGAQPVDCDHPTLFVVFIRRPPEIGGSYLWKTEENLETARMWERRYAPDALVVEYQPKGSREHL